MRSVHPLTVGAALVLVLGFSAPAQQGQLDTVIEVRVEGNKRLSEAAVLSYVKTRVGQKYDEAAVKADHRRLLDSKRFDSVVAAKTQTDKGIIVTIRVVERPVIEKVVFIGNIAFKAEELAKELGFAQGDPVNAAAVRKGQEAIAAKYRDAGYYEVSVELDSQILDARREVVYRIREGAKSYVADIVFEGNTYFTSVWLRQKIGTSKRRWPLVPGKIEMEQLAQDVQTIREMYVSDGFLSVDVDRLPLEFTPDRRKATVKFVIKEGPQFRAGRVTFKGNTVFSDEQLGKRLSLREGAVFTPLKLTRDVRELEGTYGQLGYIEAQVSARKVFQEKPGMVDLEFTIVEADQYSIGKIDIRGNKVTQSRIIRRQLSFYPEQRFDTKAMEESEHRLMETLIFEKVTIGPVGRAAPEAPRVRNVLVDVKEGQSANVLLGAGVSTDHGLVGNVSFIERNFDIMRWPRTFGETLSGRAWRGAGQTLRISAEPGTELTRFDVEWREPYLFDKPYSLGLRAFLFDRERETYDERRYGGVASIGHRFRNRWYGEFAARLEGVNIGDLDHDAPKEVLSDKGSHMLLGLKSSLTRDRTDSRWMPTTGDRLHVAYEQVVGDFTFGRLDANWHRYRTVYVDALDRKHVFKTRVAGGQIFGDAPVFEKYYGGGTSWIRGFEYRGISPRSKGTHEPIGGDFIMFAGCEYEFPILGGTSRDQLRGVLFLDSGTVEDDFGINTYRASVGTGLRWYVHFLGPVPISLDLGIPVSKDGRDDTQILSFSIGWSF